MSCRWTAAELVVDVPVVDELDTLSAGILSVNETETPPAMTQEL